MGLLMPRRIPEAARSRKDARRALQGFPGPNCVAPVTGKAFFVRVAKPFQEPAARGLAHDSGVFEGLLRDKAHRRFWVY
ncbi:hypothetical protein CGZ69_20010 [Streptomyces peucetius subsp. caesius ATCC 27952]|nr:hypothetical protein CGZ69_20010 [Streptomyces peucetius subsp. caesius ATCC 27952]